MSAVIPGGLNGRFRKSLANQLDRLDVILDGLAEALNGAVSDAVRQAVGEATREAVQMAMAEALPKQTNPEARQESPLRRLITQAKTKAMKAFQRVKQWFTASFRKLKQFSSKFGGASVRSVWVTVRSRSIRIGMLVVAVTSSLLGLFRRDSRKIWWGAGIMLSTMLLESYVGTLGTLMLGGGVVYLLKQQRDNQSPLRSIPQAA